MDKATTIGIIFFQQLNFFDYIILIESIFHKFFFRLGKYIPLVFFTPFPFLVPSADFEDFIFQAKL